MMATATARSRNGNGRPRTELLSISKIAMRCGLDRATAKKRLMLAGYEPEQVREKEKLYRFDAEMEAALTEVNDKLVDVKIRKETAMAHLAEMKAMQQNGELIAVSEVEDYLQRLFKALHQEVCVRFPKRVAGQMSKAKTAGEASEILTAGLGGIFNKVREDHGSLMVNGRSK